MYYVGIIDILQPYNIKKKVEHAFKVRAVATSPSSSKINGLVHTIMLIE